MECLINARNISKTYKVGKTIITALNSVNLSVYPGEFISIVGQSGSGKSTLINILGCLDVPTKGEYFWNEENICKINEKGFSNIRNNSIGFIFQGYNLISNLNAIENVELPLIYRGIKKSLRRTLAIDALNKTGLSNRIFHRPSQMSGGQQQRVAIARAIATDPSLILADEPTGNLDSKSGKEIFDILKVLNDNGKTVIIITHDENLARKTNRAIRIKDGRVISDNLIIKY